MDNDREFDQVLMNVRNSTGSIITASLLSARLSLQLVVYLMRLAKKGLLATGLADNFKAFSQLTEGKYTVYNIPLTGDGAANLAKLNELELTLQEEKNPLKKAGIRNEIKKLQKEMPEIAQLKELKVSHCVLPKLNGSERTVQVAVAKKDDQMFKNWFLNHLTTELSGGEKGMEEIKVLTEGNYAIYNVPFEGTELEAALPDWQTLGINYALLPDLKVGDENSQIAVPNADRSKVEVWFKMWKDKQLREGKEPGEMYVMNQESYMDTGTMAAEEYVTTSDQKYQAANAEFETQSEKVPWAAALDKENSEAYVKLLNDSNYERISINKETLVDNMEMSAKADVMRKHGYFISRIPGTYGETQQTLILPSSQVFKGDEGKTYIAFLPKNGQTMVADSSGTIRQCDFKTAYQPYDEVTRNMQKVQKLQQTAPEKKEAAVLKKEAVKAAKSVAQKVPKP